MFRFSYFAKNNVVENGRECLMEHVTMQQITPEMVRPILARHLLTDGLPIVLDMERSQGVHLYDQLTGRELIDFFGFFASSAVG